MKSLPYRNWASALSLCISATVLPLVAKAQFNYTTANGAATITGYTGPGGSVTIPDTLGGLPVVAIGNSAFSGIISITSVSVPTSVTNLGNNAFTSCVKLGSINL